MPSDPDTKAKLKEFPGMEKCGRCGLSLAEHVSANLTDGAFVGKYLTICPTVLFKPTGKI